MGCSKVCDEHSIFAAPDEVLYHFTTAGGESGIYLYASDDINNINFYEWDNLKNWF